MLSDFKIHIDVVIPQVKMCVQMLCPLYIDSKVDMVLRCMYDDVSSVWYVVSKSAFFTSIICANIYTRNVQHHIIVTIKMFDYPVSSSDCKNKK